ncbi:MAG: aspartate aminotransferase family protein [Acidobacteria bacterium]|nr:aspartate aminotransferase family protein [Acidobacteriota bacterium]
MARSWERSRALLERARKSLAGGVSSPFRAQAPVPLHFEDGRGSRLKDADGNWYIDYTLGWGPSILGYRHPAMVEALGRAADSPYTYGAQHEREFLVSEKIQSLVPCAERVLYTSSGTEAVQIAWRLCRAFTGRRLILKFEGHYHGWMDSALISYHPRADQAGPWESPYPVTSSLGQVANVVDNVLVAPWNSIEAVERVFAERGPELAAVVMEPVLCNSGCIFPRPGYLEGVRDIARRHGALLMFDEVITGFRLALGGAQQYYGVTPDISTYGKAVAGGLALSGVAGRADILEMAVGGGVAFGGSFNGNPIVLAGAHAVLEVLSSDGGAPLEQARRIGESIMEGLRAAAARHGLPVLVSGFGAAFAVHFTPRTELAEYRDTLSDDPEMLHRLVIALLEEGVCILPDGRMYVSVVHSADDAAETLAAFDRAFTSFGVS